MATLEEQRDTRHTRYVDQHAALRESLLLALLKALLGLWGGFKHWEDPDLVAGHVARSAALVDVSLSKTRRLARSYATSVLRELEALPRDLPRVEDLYPRSGASMTDVYARPAEQYLYAIQQGKSDTEAREIALKRVEDLATMDVALAERDELEEIWKLSPKIIGHRRIIHPERSKSGTCGLCVVASTRFYSMDELMPLHHECKCTSSPVTKAYDPGLRLNEDDLKEIYAAAGSTAAADLKRTRVAVKAHGELGPILVREGQNFRDVKEVNRNARGKTFTPYERPTRDNQRASWEAMRASSIDTIKRLEAARDSGAGSVNLAGIRTIVRDWDSAIKYHRDLIDRMTSKLR